MFQKYLFQKLWKISKEISLMTSSFQISWILEALLWTFSRTKLDGYNTAAFSVRMLENLDQKNSEYGHFSRSESSAITIKYKKLCGDKYLIPFMAHS